MINFVDITFYGEGFSPKQFSQLSGLNLTILAETGELSKKGKYKNSPSPYGLAYYETKIDTIASSLETLLKYKESFKLFKLEEITIDFAMSQDSLNNFHLDNSLVIAIAELNASINIIDLSDKEHRNIAA